MELQHSFHPFLLILLAGLLVNAYHDDEGLHSIQATYYENANTLLQTSESSLRFVFVVSRHGSRSPLGTFPNDLYPYDVKKYWPKGKGQLTNFGKEQLYHTGKALRQRYNSFINALYYPNDTVVQYNPYDRDYDSAACLMAGLYPPTGEEIWNSRILWQPIPMTVRDFDICDVHNFCPRYKKLQQEQWEKMNTESSSYSELLESLSNATGSNLTKLTDVYDIYDTLLMQRENGFKLPEWTKEVFTTPAKNISLNYLIISYAESDDLIKLGAGPELKHISDVLNWKAQNIGHNTRMYVEASHDCTLIALLNAMGYNDPYLEIPTSAYITYEMHEINGSYFIKIFFYKRTHDKQPTEITLPRQKNPCPLEEFTDFADFVNPGNWERECQNV